MAFEGSVNINTKSGETFYILCDFCFMNGETKEAEKYCLECDEYFCLTCIEIHLRILTKHTILDKADFPSDSFKIRSSVKPVSSPKEQPPAPTEKCDLHRHHYIDMYCQNHDDVGCGTCIAIDHRCCPDIFYIPDFVQNNKNESSATEIRGYLLSTFSTLIVNQKDLQYKKKWLLTMKAESLEDIRKFRKEINDRLDELEQNSLTEVENKYKSLINKIEETIKLLHTMTDNVSSAQDKITAIGKNVSQDFVNAKKGDRVLRSAAKCLEVNQTLIQTEDTEFIAEHRILALLQEMNVLGKVRQKSNTEYKASDKDERQQTDRERKPDPTEQRESLLQVKKSHSYSVKVKSDKWRCNIVSACIMEDGTLILSDQLNKNLKRLESSTFTVTDYCELPETPWQVCPINMQQVAVCLPDNKQVTFINVSKRMTTSNKITTNFKCYGLAHTGGNLYISDLDKSVYIYTISGQKLKQFTKDQSGQEMFSDIYSLAVNEDGTRIYVTDLNNGLIVLDNYGKVVGKVSGSQLNGACGCFLTGNGSLLVCGYKSKIVLQFGLNGELIGEVIKSSGFSKAVCCNKQMSKLVVAQDDEDDDEFDDDKIVVYDIINTC